MEQELRTLFRYPESAPYRKLPAWVACVMLAEQWGVPPQVVEMTPLKWQRRQALVNRARESVQREKSTQADLRKGRHGRY